MILDEDVEDGAMFPTPEGHNNTNVINARAGHSVGERLQSVNLAYADGHVETRTHTQIQWQESGNWTTFY